MSTSEKFCLKWNDFQQNVCKTFLQLRQQTELFDVKYRILQLSEEYLPMLLPMHIVYSWVCGNNPIHNASSSTNSIHNQQLHEI